MSQTLATVSSISMPTEHQPKLLGCIMPIRIRCCDKPPDRQQATENKGIITPSLRNPKACHMGRKPNFRILCGSG